jgi:hypothetical protein
LIMPFEPQRDYWSDSVKSTAGNAPTRGGNDAV